MNCPVCKDEGLGLIKHENQQLHRCISCSGLLISTNDFIELQKENDRHLSALLTKPGKVSKKNKDSRKCPSCGKTMKCTDYEWDSNIEIEVCEDCSLIWLDGGEMAAIHEHLKKEHPELIESELEHETKKFFNWVKYLLSKAGEITPRIG